MYVHLQPGQEPFLIFKLRLKKCTRDDIMYESWNNVFEKEIRWIDILHFGAHDNENNSAKHRCTDKLINNVRISNVSIKTIIVSFGAGSELFYNQQEQTNNHFRCEIDDPCDTVDIIFEDFPKHDCTKSLLRQNLVTLRFHRVSNIVEIVPIRSHIDPKKYEHDGYANNELYVFFYDERMILYRFSLELIGDIASTDTAEELLEMQRIERFWIHFDHQTERCLTMMEQRIRCNPPDINEMIQLDILSAHGFEVDSIRVSFQVSTSCGWRAISNDVVICEKKSKEKTGCYRQTNIAKCALENDRHQYMTLMSLLIGIVASLCVLAFEIHVVRFCIILFAIIVFRYEASREYFTNPRGCRNETLKASFTHSISLQKMRGELSSSIQQLQVFFIVSTHLEDIESIISFGTLNAFPEMSDYDLNIPTMRIVSAPGMPEWWLRLYEYFLGSPLTNVRIVQLLLEGPNMITTQASGSIKLRFRRHTFTHSPKKL